MKPGAHLRGSNVTTLSGVHDRQRPPRMRRNGLCPRDYGHRSKVPDRAISGLVSNLPRAKPMFITAAQCRAKAEEKLALAKRDPVHRRKLEDAARAWLILSDRMEDEPEEKE